EVFYYRSLSFPCSCRQMEDNVRRRLAGRSLHHCSFLGRTQRVPRVKTMTPYLAGSLCLRALYYLSFCLTKKRPYANTLVNAYLSFCCNWEACHAIARRFPHYFSRRLLCRRFRRRELGTPV